MISTLVFSKPLYSDLDNIVKDYFFSLSLHEEPENYWQIIPSKYLVNDYDIDESKLYLLDNYVNKELWPINECLTKLSGKNLILCLLYLAKLLKNIRMGYWRVESILRERSSHSLICGRKLHIGSEPDELFESKKGKEYANEIINILEQIYGFDILSFPFITCQIFSHSTAYPKYLQEKINTFSKQSYFYLWDLQDKISDRDYFNIKSANNETERLISLLIDFYNLTDKTFDLLEKLTYLFIQSITDHKNQITKELIKVEYKYINYKFEEEFGKNSKQMILINHLGKVFDL